MGIRADSTQWVEVAGAGLCPPLLTWPHPAYGMALWRENSDVPAVMQEHRRLQGRAEHGGIPG